MKDGDAEDFWVTNRSSRDLLYRRTFSGMMPGGISNRGKGEGHVAQLVVGNAVDCGAHRPESTVSPYLGCPEYQSTIKFLSNNALIILARNCHA